MTATHMLIALAALQFLDLLTTHYALRRNHGTEGNPVLRSLFEKFGHEPVLIVTKLAFCVFLWWAVPQLHGSPYEWTMWAILVMYVGIVGNNVRVILKSKSSEAQMR